MDAIIVIHPRNRSDMPNRDKYIQSSATDIIGKDTKEKITAMMKELEDIGASISLQLHDEMIFYCVPGTEDQVKAIHEKYFPEMLDWQESVKNSAVSGTRQITQTTRQTDRVP